MKVLNSILNIALLAQNVDHVLAQEVNVLLDWLRLLQRSQKENICSLWTHTVSLESRG